MLSRLVITLLQRNKNLLISWLQSLSAVILDPKKIKSVTASTFSPALGHWGGRVTPGPVPVALAGSDPLQEAVNDSLLLIMWDRQAWPDCPASASLSGLAQHPRPRIRFHSSC